MKTDSGRRHAQYSLSLTHRHAGRGAIFAMCIEAEIAVILCILKLNEHSFLGMKFCLDSFAVAALNHLIILTHVGAAAQLLYTPASPLLVPWLATAARVALGGACTYRVEREFHSSWLWYYCHCQCSHSAWAAVTAAARPRAHAWAASGIPLHYEQSFSACQKNYEWSIFCYFI